MTRRMWQWLGALLGLGALDLALTIHARAGWHPPATSAQASLDLGQLMGFITSAGLLVFAALIAISGWRRHRARRRFEQIRDRALGAQPYVDGTGRPG